MGLFDRLFGKKEEPKIEEVVKEALENLDLSEDIEPAFTEAEEVSQEEAEVESSEESVFQEEDSQDTVEENLDLEPVVEVSQEEVEEFPNSQEVT
ncbi:TPA: signal recognition particle-docking protein FtsY, partial [Streptococcus pneumoniae]|nr:signal recognition particle-docking protein FtsY [Streptococcus pneumoniae]